MSSVASWISKAQGSGGVGLRRPALQRAGFTFVISFLGMLALSGIHQFILENNDDYIMIIGSQGAAAVLVFNAIGSPLAQPRNVILGNTLSAAVGVATRKIFPDELTWLAIPVSVSTAILVMDMTRSVHPPGGATSLIAVIGSTKIRELGWMYILVPALAGSTVLVAFAVLLNNLSGDRSYPTSWTGPAPAAPKPAPEGGAVDVTAAAELSTLVGDIIFEHPAAGSVAHRNGTTRVSTV